MAQNEYVSHIIGITYAGNHGMEINNADGTTFTQTMSGDYQQKLMKMLDTLNREARMFILNTDTC